MILSVLFEVIYDKFHELNSQITSSTKPYFRVTTSHTKRYYGFTEMDTSGNRVNTAILRNTCYKENFDENNKLNSNFFQNFNYYFNFYLKRAECLNIGIYNPSTSGFLFVNPERNITDYKIKPKKFTENKYRLINEQYTPWHEKETLYSSKKTNIMI